MVNLRKRKKFYKFMAAKHFYVLSNYLVPFFVLTLLIFGFYGVMGGLFLAPADYQQGDAFRILYIHVPSAFLSLFIFSGVSLIFRIKLAEWIVSSSVFLGTWFTFLALFTGSVWAKPMWGAWWVWDARLTSELILLFLYLGVIALYAAIPERHMATQTTAILILLGLANLPIIHYSVYWWNTLHQGATIHFLSPSLMERSMLYPLLSMIMAFVSFYLVILLLNIRCKILEQHLNEG